MKNLNSCKAEYFRYFYIRVQEQLSSCVLIEQTEPAKPTFSLVFLAFKKCNCTSSSKYIFVDSWQKSPFIYFYTSTFCVATVWITATQRCHRHSIFVFLHSTISATERNLKAFLENRIFLNVNLSIISPCETFLMFVFHQRQLQSMFVLKTTVLMWLFALLKCSREALLITLNREWIKLVGHRLCFRCGLSPTWFCYGHQLILHQMFGSAIII